MDIQTVMGHLNDTAGDVGAMVGHPLQAGQQVRPDKAQFNGTFPFLQPQNMPVPQLLLQGIHHLLQRLHFGSQRRVVLEEGVQRQVHHFSHRRGEYRLHTYDVHKLLEVLDRLVEGGNTVVVIEHNLDVIKWADHVIDLGPEGGSGGGHVVCTGTPEEVAQCEASYTGRYLKKLLK